MLMNRKRGLGIFVFSVLLLSILSVNFVSAGLFSKTKITGKVILDDNGWTSWLDRDNPDGSGDWETLTDFVNLGQVCENPSDVEYRTVNGEVTSQIVHSSTTSGFYCLNSENSEGCLDYEVRFKCGGGDERPDFSIEGFELHSSEDFLHEGNYDRPLFLKVVNKGEDVLSAHLYAELGVWDLNGNLMDNCEQDLWANYFRDSEVVIKNSCFLNIPVGTYFFKVKLDPEDDFEELDELNNEFSQRVQIMDSNFVCKDSDNRLDYYNKGTVEGYNNIDFREQVISDTCLDSAFLREYYCETTNGISNGNIGIGDYNCPNGCVDGACVEEEKTCTDSDGGWNYYVKGEVKNNENSVTDLCNKYSGVLEEYACDDANGNILMRDVECDNGCVDGACVLPNITNSYCENGECFLYEGNKVYPYVSSKNRTIEIVYISATKVKLKVDGENTNYLSALQTQNLENGVKISIIDIFFDSKDSGISGVNFKVEEIGSDCSSHSYKKCYNGNSYWYDSCGVLQEAYDLCDGNEICIDGECISQESYCDSNGQCLLYEGDEVSSTNVEADWSIEYISSNSVKLRAGDITFNSLQEGESQIKEYEGYNYETKYVQLTIIDIFFDSKDTGISSVSFQIRDFSCSSGECSLDGKCYPLGYRKSGDYCSESGEFVKQFGDDEVCDNNFECNTNLCIDGQCVSSGLIQRILNWFRRVFGGG